jgi:hypothetical protein
VVCGDWKKRREDGKGGIGHDVGCWGKLITGLG